MPSDKSIRISGSSPYNTVTSNTGVSTDTEESHLAWIRTPRKRGGLGHMQIPLVADVKKTISADYG